MGQNTEPVVVPEVPVQKTPPREIINVTNDPIIKEPTTTTTTITTITGIKPKNPVTILPPENVTPKVDHSKAKVLALSLSLSLGLTGLAGFGLFCLLKKGRKSDKTTNSVSLADSYV